VVFAEHIADHKNLSTIIEQDLLEEPGLHRTLLGDGVGSMVGAFFGGCPNTTYGESVGCVAITRNASVATIITAAIGAIIISFVLITLTNKFLVPKLTKLSYYDKIVKIGYIIAGAYGAYSIGRNSSANVTSL
jgi:uracil permease